MKIQCDLKQCNSIWLVISLLTQFLHLDSVSFVLALVFILLSLTAYQTSQIFLSPVCLTVPLFSLHHLSCPTSLFSLFSLCWYQNFAGQLTPVFMLTCSLFSFTVLISRHSYSTFFSPTRLTPYDHISLPTSQTQSPEFSAFIGKLLFGWLILGESLIIAHGATWFKSKSSAHFWKSNKRYLQRL